MEPIISGGGVLVPPDEYLPRVRELCDEYGVLLIFDEVVSGYGRTGKLFGHDHWDVKPDIITMAKGLSSGYMPLAATAVQQYIFDTFMGEPGDLSHFRHINTFGGHPVSTAVGLRNLEIVEEEGLTENARQLGDYALAQLKNLSSHPWVGEARGRGLLLGVELVADKETKQPLDDAEDAGHPRPLQTGRRHPRTQRQHRSRPVQHPHRRPAPGGDRVRNRSPHRGAGLRPGRKVIRVARGCIDYQLPATDHRPHQTSRECPASPAAATG